MRRNNHSFSFFQFYSFTFLFYLFLLFPEWSPVEPTKVKQEVIAHAHMFWLINFWIFFVSLMVLSNSYMSINCTQGIGRKRDIWNEKILTLNPLNYKRSLGSMVSSLLCYRRQLRRNGVLLISLERNPFWCMLSFQELRTFVVVNDQKVSLLKKILWFDIRSKFGP